MFIPNQNPTVKQYNIYRLFIFSPYLIEKTVSDCIPPQKKEILSAFYINQICKSPFEADIKLFRLKFPNT